MKAKGILLILGGVLLLAGVTIVCIAFSLHGFSVSMMSTQAMVTNTFEISDPFDNINIEGDTEDLVFERSTDGKCTVVCYEYEEQPHSVTVENGRLNISILPGSYLHFGLITESPKTTVYLPGETYKKLTIDTDTGDVDLPKDFSFSSLHIQSDTGDVNCLASADTDITIATQTGRIRLADITASSAILTSDTGRMELSGVDLTGALDITEDTGDVTLKNVKAASLKSDGDTGEILLTNVTASGEFRIKRTTGDVTFDGSDAEAVYVTTDTGDVKGTFLTDKVYITKTDTGSVDVPGSTSGGRCEITTDTGDIKLSVK